MTAAKDDDEGNDERLVGDAAELALWVEAMATPEDQPEQVPTP